MRSLRPATFRRLTAAMTLAAASAWCAAGPATALAALRANQAEIARDHAGLRLLSYNIRHGTGLDGRTDLERIAGLVRDLDPDVVALQEVDRGASRTGGVDQAAALARLTGFDAFFAAFMDYRGGEYGMAILTRLPVIEAKRVALPWDAEPRASAVVTVQSSGGPVTIANVHFYRSRRQRLAQAKALHKALEPATHPVVWVGDFNSFRGDAVMSWLDGRYAQPAKEGRPDTFPADRPSREIDFVVFTPEDAFEVLEYEVVSESVMSDHRPVLAVLEPRPSHRLRRRPATIDGHAVPAITRTRVQRPGPKRARDEPRRLPRAVAGALVVRESGDDGLNGRGARVP